MNMNPERFTTYKSLSPVLTTQTTAGKEKYIRNCFSVEVAVSVNEPHVVNELFQSMRVTGHSLIFEVGLFFSGPFCQYANAIVEDNRLFN
jgi:hypothetical protein